MTTPARADHTAAALADARTGKIDMTMLSPAAAARSIDRQQAKPARHILPATRSSITHKFSVAGHEGYLTVGLHADGTPGELFIKMAKEGSTMKGWCQAFCRAFSLSLQYGLPLEDAIARFKGMRFEPMGHTSNPSIPHADSVVDYIARYLELEFCSPRD